MNRRLKQIVLPLLFISVIAIVVLLIDLASMTASYRAQSNREINQLVGTMVETNPDLDVSQIVEALNSSNIALAQKGEEALKLAKDKRDSGFQIFYVFINVGGLIAPFVAPLIRSWWLKVNGFIYNAKLPALCHEQLNGTLSGDKLTNYNELSTSAVVEAGTAFDPTAYLEIFNQVVHF